MARRIFPCITWAYVPSQLHFMNESFINAVQSFHVLVAGASLTLSLSLTWSADNTPQCPPIYCVQCFSFQSLKYTPDKMCCAVILPSPPYSIVWFNFGQSRCTLSYFCRLQENSHTHQTKTANNYSQDPSQLAHSLTWKLKMAFHIFRK